MTGGKGAHGGNRLFPPWFRREPLHERLAREAGLDAASEPPPHDTTPRWGETGIHGVPRPRQWDAVATADAPGLLGDRVRFVVLPDGTLVVEEEAGDGDLAPLAEAVEATLGPPYRAEAVRRSETLWAIAARAIEVVELREEIDGDELELAVRDGERTLLVDGRQEFGSVLELERLAAERYDSYVVRGERIDGPFWEVKVTPL